MILGSGIVAFFVSNGSQRIKGIGRLLSQRIGHRQQGVYLFPQIRGRSAAIQSALQVRVPPVR